MQRPLFLTYFVPTVKEEISELRPHNCQLYIDNNKLMLDSSRYGKLGKSTSQSINRSQLNL